MDCNCQTQHNRIIRIRTNAFQWPVANEHIHINTVWTTNTTIHPCLSTLHKGKTSILFCWQLMIYTVSTKKLHPCIRCHNSGKQCRILTKFYANTETLNCKQVTKFQQNRSTAATATASLVRSLKSISVHYRHRRDWLSSVRPCEWPQIRRVLADIVRFIN